MRCGSMASMKEHAAMKSHALNFSLSGAVAFAALTLLAGCEPNGRPVMRADTFPMGYADKFDQPIRSEPLFGSKDYLRERDVWPQPVAQVAQALPPAVPLPEHLARIEVIAPKASTAQPGEEQGGVTPAAGMAAVITNAQGDGEANQLDGGKSK
jgi:hypothetical protein